MALNPIDYATYTALRDLDLSHPDLDATAPPPAGTERWLLGHTSSWARWTDATEDVSPITANSSAEFEALEPLTTSVVVLTTNRAGGGSIPRIWGAFHSTVDDVTAADSVRHVYSRIGPVPAPYMTDIFKLLPTLTTELTSSTTTQQQSHDQVGRCAEILRQELSLCVAGSNGRAPTLVAVGGQAYSWLSGRDWSSGRPIADQRIAEAVNDVLGAGATKQVQWMPEFSPGVATHNQRANALGAILARAHL